MVSLSVATRIGLFVVPVLLVAAPARAYVFTPGDLVISVSGNVGGYGPVAGNAASPLMLQEITQGGLRVGSIVLPQVTTTVNGVTQNAISAEYGSSSEGLLSRSADGKSLVIAGYGVNATTFNTAAPSVYGATKNGANALAQTTSIQGGANTAVARVVASIGAGGAVDTSTALFGVFDRNNPRSVATVDGTTFYLAGQGAQSPYNTSGTLDTATEGVFYATKGASAAIQIDGTTDTRSVQIANGKLYASRDIDTPSLATISSYGLGLPTTATTPANLPGINTQIAALTSAQANNVDRGRIGNNVYLSPEQYFFADANTLYIADSGNPKNGNVNRAQLGDGGLQKWALVGGTWVYEYNIFAGLGIVKNAVDNNTKVTTGTSGLIGLTGKVIGGNVLLFATNSTLGDTDQTYVFGVTDQLSATALQAGEAFSTIFTADAGTNIRGIAFAPEDASINVPEPASMALLAGMVGAAGLVRRRSRR